MQNNKKKAKVILYGIVILIITVIILLIFSKILYEELISSSIPNIIENNIPRTSKVNTSVILNVTDYLDKSETTEIITDKYTIFSENADWKEIETIEIFKNKYYKETMIAPGIEGKYQFDINNGLKISTNNAIQFEETNNKNINMKYKIKLGDTYLIKDWTKIEDIELPVFTIPGKLRTKFTVEWKWIDSSNDTEIGIAAKEAIYKVKVLINSTEI